MKKISDKLRQPLWLAAIMLLTIYLFIGRDYRFTYNHGESMDPTISSGEVIVVQKKNRLPKGWSPDRNDIVIIYDKGSSDKLTKRVLGLSGDIIGIKEGVVYLNERELRDSFGQGKIGHYLVDADDNELRYWSGPQKGEPVFQLANQTHLEIPEGYVWVIGDNRSISWYGLLPIEDIKGLVIF
jgi:signal peptidase I